MTETVVLGESGRIVLLRQSGKSWVSRPVTVDRKQRPGEIRILSRKMALESIRADIVKQRGSLAGLLDEFLAERERKQRVNKIVLDASAVLAMILEEPGRARGCASGFRGVWLRCAGFISSVNWCEILTRMQRENLAISGERLSAVLPALNCSICQSRSGIAAAFSHVSRALSLGIELVWLWPKANKL